MFRTAVWLQDIAQDSDIDIAGYLISIAGPGSGGPGGLSLPGLGTLEGALRIPIVGNVIGGVLGLAFGFLDASDISNYMTAFQDAADFLAGNRTDANGQLVAASSVLVLDPVAQRLAHSINVRSITAGGYSFACAW